MSGSPALLVATDLVKRYGGVVASDKLSLTLAPGEIVGIVGPNGAGKSTFIGLLGGAIRPDEGGVQFEGRDVSSASAAERARLGIGRTYQIPRPFLNMSVRENLLAARFSHFPLERSAQAFNACNQLLERTGLADVAGLPARALTLLRRKRLEVARALALEPKLLLLDEVGAGLVDSEVTELIQLIQSLGNEVQGVIIIEHVLRVVRECCQRLVVLNFGRKLAEGPTAEVLASDEVAAVYLGTARKDREPTPGQVFASTAQPRQTASMRSSPKDEEQAAPILELEGVHAGYGQARVLNGIDLTIRKGEVIAVLGTNGAGKTTLANVISGLVRPNAGTVRVDGETFAGETHQLAALGISQCMEGRRIFGSLSVEENLLMAARGARKMERQERLKHVYDLFPDLRERRANAGTSMSGGQQQMLAIGRSLMAKPRLIVFDEISLGLAPVTMDRLYAALTELKRSGLTMLIVEQDIERALDIADRVHVMENGRFALSGSTESIRDDPRLRHLYIGTAD